jgi:hypothetical protein
MRYTQSELELRGYNHYIIFDWINNELTINMDKNTGVNHERNNSYHSP